MMKSQSLLQSIPKSILKVLKDKSGLSYPLTIAIVIGLFLLFLVVTEYMKMIIICGGVKDSFEEAIISVVNDNYNEVYHCVREGYAAGYEPNGDETFYASIDTGDVGGRLSSLLQLSDNSGQLTRAGTDGAVEYTISNIHVSIHNAPMVRSGEDFYAEGTLLLKIPVRFAGKMIANLPINLKVKAELDEVF